MDKVKFFNQQLNGQIVMAELEAEHLAKSIRRFLRATTMWPGLARWQITRPH